MNAIYKKQGIVVLITTTLIVCASFIENKPAENEPSADVKTLDAKLLTDLQIQEVQFDKKTECLMSCVELNKSEILQLLDIKNVNYGKCEPGNCHYTSYTIEGKTSEGKKLQFKIDSGEDGNIVRDLQIEGSDCNCN